MWDAVGIKCFFHSLHVNRCWIILPLLDKMLLWYTVQPLCKLAYSSAYLWIFLVFVCLNTSTTFLIILTLLVNLSLVRQIFLLPSASELLHSLVVLCHLCLIRFPAICSVHTFAVTAVVFKCLFSSPELVAWIVGASVQCGFYSFSCWEPQV